MIVDIESEDILELTITKTGLDVLQDLGKVIHSFYISCVSFLLLLLKIASSCLQSFSEAVTENIGGSNIALENAPPYELKNEVKIFMDDESSFVKLKCKSIN